VPNTRAGTFHTAVDAGSVMEEDLHIDNYAFAGFLIDDPMLGMVNGWESNTSGAQKLLFTKSTGAVYVLLPTNR